MARNDNEKAKNRSCGRGHHGNKFASLQVETALDRDQQKRGMICGESLCQNDPSEKHRPAYCQAS